MLFVKYSASHNGLTFKSGLGSFEVTEYGTIRKLRYSFLFTFHNNVALYCFISEIKQDIVWK